MLTAAVVLSVPGLLLPHRGEVRRHPEGQGAETLGAAAAAAAAAAQRRLHVGKPDRLRRPGAAVPRGELKNVWVLQ